MEGFLSVYSFLLSGQTRNFVHKTFSAKKTVRRTEVFPRENFCKNATLRRCGLCGAARGSEFFKLSVLLAGECNVAYSLRSDFISV